MLCRIALILQKNTTAMIRKRTIILSLVLSLLLSASVLQAQPRYNMSTINRENLNRGVVAIRSNGKVVVSWRQLTSDADGAHRKSNH